MSFSGHFQEAFAVELPSQLQTYSSSKGFQAYSGTCDKSQNRIATEHHAVYISMDNARGSMEVSTHSLPNPNHQLTANQSCIAHSYLPIPIDETAEGAGTGTGTGGYLEAFILRSTAATSDDRKDVVQNAASISGDGKIDESKSSIDRSAHKVNEHKYYILVKGYLPNIAAPSRTRTDQKAASPTDAQRGHGNDKHHDAKSAKTDRKAKKENKHDRDRSKQCLKDDINVYQSFPVSFCASTIELCHIEETQQGFDKDKAINFAIYVADNSEIKMYTLMLLEHHQMKISIENCNEKFQIQENTLTPQNASSDLINQRSDDDDFMSFLEQKPPGPVADKSPLLFPSPITTMTSFVYMRSMNNDLSPIYMLSVGCQDGSIRIISYRTSTSPKEVVENRGENDLDSDALDSSDRSQQLSFDVINISQFVIDGPISALSYSFHGRDHGETEKLTLFAGSLCGFACYFTQTEASNGLQFDGAYPLIDGLWDARLSDEDGVLSICEFQYGGVDGGRIVALGMHSGRLLLFANVKSQSLESPGDLNDSIEGSWAPSFYCFWHCTLQNPIRDIQAIENGLFSDMVVCTRRNIHLLRSNPDYIADATFERVEQLLHTFLEK